MRKIHFIWINLVAVFCGNIWAQSTPDLLAGVTREPLPSGQLVKRLPGFASWKILYRDSAGQQEETQQDPAEQEKAAAAPIDKTDLSAPREVSVTRTGSIWTAKYVLKKHQRMGVWSVEGMRFLEFAKDPPRAWQDVFSDLGDFTNVDFPDTEWISDKTYVGIQKTKNNTYLVFRQAGGDQGKQTLAWVDSATRIPVRWQRGDQVRLMQVLPAPTSILTPPKDIQQQVDELIQSEIRMFGKRLK